MKGVIFDMDGTMFDSESIWQDMWCHLPEQYGFAPNDRIGADMCGATGEYAAEVIKKYYPKLDPAEFIQRGREEYKKRLLAKQPEEKTGLREIVSHLKDKGYKLAVASGSEEIVIAKNMERAGMTDDFDALVSDRNVPNGKPAPDIFLEAARRLDLKPEECYVIEDGEHGIIGAYRAGCVPIMVPDTIAPTEKIRELGIGIYESLLDVIELI